MAKKEELEVVILHPDFWWNGKQINKGEKLVVTKEQSEDLISRLVAELPPQLEVATPGK